MSTRPQSGAPDPAVPDPAVPDPDVSVEPVGPVRRRRRAVRRGPGQNDPSVGLHAADDLDVGWQPAADDSNDERLRRDVPPHW